MKFPRKSASSSGGDPPKGGWRQYHKKQRRHRENDLIKALKANEAENEKFVETSMQNNVEVATETATECDQEAIRGRSWTLSVAVPGSILDNAQSPELKAYLVGQIARAAALFCVDEIVVYDDCAQLTDEERRAALDPMRPNPNILMSKLLMYAECPQYLRKQLFPLCPELKHAGLLTPLDAPHHLRSDDLSIPYREAVVLDKPAKDGRAYVNAGFRREVSVDQSLPVGTRITMELQQPVQLSRKIRGTVVSWSKPRKRNGIYWGYKVRVANSLSAVFTEFPYNSKKAGKTYDLTFGISENGTSVDEYEASKKFKHAIVVFGGLHGLEAALENDESLHVDDASLLFDHYLNTCPRPGTKTVRTEEAMLISLSALRMKLSDVHYAK